MIYYAVGDIHGRNDLLEIMHDRIMADRQLRHPDLPATVVHVGDYIDRGFDSPGVIDRLMRGLAGFETICLKGNHEALLLDCLESEERQVWWRWLRNGGDATLASLGIPQHGACDSGRLARALGAHRVAWLKSLALFHRIPGYLFVHAGIRPGAPLEAQLESDLIWIRDSFLDSEEDFGFRVIHGHTPVDRAEIRHNRIGIDTGAVFTGHLTAAVIGDPAGLRLIEIAGA